MYANVNIVNSSGKISNENSSEDFLRFKLMLGSIRDINVSVAIHNAFGVFI